MSEKLCLQWNDFKDNTIASFRSLRDNDEFADVTLVCEDGKHIQAHKVILASSSPVFHNILTSKTHTHPWLIYMRKVKSEELSAIVDFLYCGETSIYQENLDSFLAISEELQLRGLMGKTNQEEELHKEDSDLLFKKSRQPIIEKQPKSFDSESKQHNLETSYSGTLALSGEYSLDFQKLDEKIHSMMEKTSRKSRHGNPIYGCNTCGKEGEKSELRKHIEANHLEGVLIPCNLCEETFRSRNARDVQIFRHHKVPKY